MRMIWQPEMSIDGDFIDQDHRDLIAMINRFHDEAAETTSKEALVTMLEDLWKMVVQHFSQEEALQHGIDFPLLEAHRREHESLRRRLETIIDVTSNQSGQDVASLSQSVFALLRTWLVDHLMHSDTLMRRYLPAQCNGKPARVSA